MKSLARYCCLVLTVFALSGCDYFWFLNEADNSFPQEFAKAYTDTTVATLYSLKPYPPSNGPDNFHGYAVLGEMPLDKAQVTFAYNQLKDATDKDVGVSNCHIAPRHGMRVKKDGHVYDLLICYQCGQIIAYKDGKEIRYLDFSSTRTIATPAYFNELLIKERIPLPEEE